MLYFQLNFKKKDQTLLRQIFTTNCEFTISFKTNINVYWQLQSI